MNVNNIVLPSGIISTLQGPQSTEKRHDRSENEDFDLIGVVEQRTRSRSLSYDQRSHDGNADSQQLAPFNGITEDASRQTVDGFKSQSPSSHTPQELTTVDLDGLGTSRVTGISTPANPRVRLDLTPNASLSTKATAVTTLPETSNSNRLIVNDSHQTPKGGHHWDPEVAPRSVIPPVYLPRSNSERKAGCRPEARFKPLQRGPWSGLIDPTIDTDNRPNVVTEQVVGKIKGTVTQALRRSSIHSIYDKAKLRQIQLQRSTAAQLSFQYAFYLLILATVYFLFVGFPLWKGLVLTILYLFQKKLVLPAGTAIFLGIGFLYAYLPLVILLEPEPPTRLPRDSMDSLENEKANSTALLIPCYKSAKLIRPTLDAALRIFPAQNIFVVANGNSPTPLDNTAEICEEYGVSHTWCPIGSKIVAQFVGCYVSKSFPYVLLIDDDCLLPPNFPIVTDRIRGNTLCVGYTIKSVGPNGSKGTLCQQAQDVEYKISGLQRAFAGKVGSATFPHGAISIWDRKLLIKTFQAHPGFSVSEDWFFGHVARQLGCRIQMCTAIFVETETPDSIFFSTGGERGGFGEMTLFKQRFYRWNYFFVSGMFWDMSYIFRRWKLGWWEIGAKLFVFQEVYETLLYLLAPFVLPISFYVKPEFSAYLYSATLALYQINVIIFNYVHLRSRNESVSVLCLLYYLPFKMILTFVNIASCYYSIYKYAKYFAKRHPKVIEDEKAVAIVLKLEEDSYSDDEKSMGDNVRFSIDSVNAPTRRFTITAVDTGLAPFHQEHQQGEADVGTNVVDFATPAAPVVEYDPSREPTQVSSQTSQKSPTVPIATRPFSWQRMTSRARSDSNRSPFDEGKSPQFPVSSPVIDTAEPTTHEDIIRPNERTTSSPRGSPILRTLSSLSSSVPSLQARLKSDNRQTVTSPRRPSAAASPSSHRRDSSRNSGPNSLVPWSTMEQSTTTTSRKPHQLRSFGPAQHTGNQWPLTREQSDIDHYISLLADTSNPKRESGHSDQSEWLVIKEDDEGNEGDTTTGR